MSLALGRTALVAFLAGLGLSFAGQAVNGAELAIFAGAQLLGHFAHSAIVDAWHHIRGQGDLI